MNVKRILSKSADYQKFEVLKTNRNKRFKYNEFFVEGVRNINEAIKNNWDIVSFIYCYETPLSNWATDVIKSNSTQINYELSSQLMAELSGKEDTSELMAIMTMRTDNLSALKLSTNPLMAIFDRPSNKGNLGTIIRTCDALGVDALIITGHCVDLYDPDVVVSSMGSFFKVPVIRIPDNQTVENFITSLKEKYNGFQVVGTTAHSEKNLWEIDFTNPTMFMIGNETDGLCKRFTEISDIMATIPMAQDCCASSFNVACAATAMLYEAVKQRNCK